MPSIDIDFMKKLHEDYKNYSCLIETGTAEGGTIFSLEPHFDKLYTIEVSEMFYNNTKNRYYGNKIQFMLGDSSVVFETLLPNIDDKTIFFLDGHWSGGITGRSTKDVPLIEEITCIYDLFKPEAILIIDDFRLFGMDKSSGIIGEDWSKIKKEEIVSILGSRVKEVYHLDSYDAEDDRLIIHIKAKE